MYFENGKLAYDGFWKRGFDESGSPTTGTDNVNVVNYSNSSVTMRLSEEIADFQINLGNGYIALISLNGKQATLKLFLDGILVMHK